MNKNNIKYPFPTAAIFLFISTFFYFFNLCFIDELPLRAEALALPAILRFFSVIALGVFLLVKRAHLGTLIACGSLLLTQIIEAFIFGDVSQSYLYYGYDGPLFLNNLLIIIAITFIFLLALTNVVNNGFKKLANAWFVGIIISAIAFFLNFVISVSLLEEFPTEIEDYIMFNVFGNILLSVAFCLMPRWFRDVAKEQSKINTIPEIPTPQANYYSPSNIPVYDPFANIEEKEPIKQEDDDAEALRKYKALYDEGVITEEEFELKKKQILNI